MYTFVYMISSSIYNMSLEVKEAIKCNKCDRFSRLDSVEVINNKYINAHYLCECGYCSNMLVDIIDIITEKELQRKTIADLLNDLEAIDKNKLVITDIYDKSYIENSFGSDRGTYSAMYISTTDNEKFALTVEGLIELLNNALNEGIMHGYRGSEINIHKDTYLTLGEHGKSGVFIMDIQEVNNYLKILTEISI